MSYDITPSHTQIIKQYLGITLSEDKPLIKLLSDEETKTYRISAEALKSNKDINKQLNKQVTLIQAIIKTLEETQDEARSPAPKIQEKTSIILDIFADRVSLIDSMEYSQSPKDRSSEHELSHALQAHLENLALYKKKGRKEKPKESKISPFSLSSEISIPSLHRKKVHKDIITKDNIAPPLSASPEVCIVSNLTSDSGHGIGGKPPAARKLNSLSLSSFTNSKEIKTKGNITSSCSTSPEVSISPTLSSELNSTMEVRPTVKKPTLSFTSSSESRSNNSPSPRESPRNIKALTSSDRSSSPRKSPRVSISSDPEHDSYQRLKTNSPRFIPPPKRVWSKDAMEYSFFYWQSVYRRQKPPIIQKELKKKLKQTGEYSLLKKEGGLHKSFLGTIVENKLCYFVNLELDPIDKEEKKESLSCTESTLKLVDSPRKLDRFPLKRPSLHAQSNNFTILTGGIELKREESLSFEVEEKKDPETVEKKPDLKSLQPMIEITENQTIKKHKTKHLKVPVLPLSQMGAKAKLKSYEDPAGLGQNIARQIAYIELKDCDGNQIEDVFSKGLREGAFNDPGIFTLCTLYLESIVSTLLNHLPVADHLYIPEIMSLWKAALNEGIGNEEDLSNNTLAEILDDFLSSILKMSLKFNSPSCFEKFYCSLKPLTQQSYTMPFMAVREALLSFSKNQFDIEEKSGAGSRSMIFYLEKDYKISFRSSSAVNIKIHSHEKLHSCELFLISQMCADFSSRPLWKVKHALGINAPVKQEEYRFLEQTLINPLISCGYSFNF